MIGIVFPNDNHDWSINQRRKRQEGQNICNKLWKESHRNYQTLSSLGIMDYFSSEFSKETKKKAIKLALPTSLAMWLFKKQYYG